MTAARPSSRRTRPHRHASTPPAEHSPPDAHPQVTPQQPPTHNVAADPLPADLNEALNHIHRHVGRH